jgi:copper chaperone CopZ
VRKALERVPGVIEATADNKSKRAEVQYDPDKVSADELAAALGKSGFPASVRVQ